MVLRMSFSKLLSSLGITGKQDMQKAVDIKDELEKEMAASISYNKSFSYTATQQQIDQAQSQVNQYAQGLAAQMGYQAGQQVNQLLGNSLTTVSTFGSMGLGGLIGGSAGAGVYPGAVVTQGPITTTASGFQYRTTYPE